MSTIQQIITRVDAVKPNAFEAADKFRAIVALEGRIMADILLIAPEELDEMHFEYPGDLSSELVVKWPFDDIYELWLKANVDEWNGEYKKYNNTYTQFNDRLGEFVRWYARNFEPAQGMRRPCNPPYYFTAYGLAVLRGFEGTPDEWLLSLKGERGDNVELRVADGYVQWKPESDGEWNDLISVDELQTDALKEAIEALFLKKPTTPGMSGQTLYSDGEGGQYWGGVPIASVNGKTGTVVLDAEDVGALPDDTEIPSKTSDLTNDSGFVQGTLIVAQRSTLTTANKTNAEIYAAYQAGRQIVFEDYEDSNLFDLIYCTTTEAWFAQAFPTGIYLFKLINNVLTSSTVLLSDYQTKNINDAGGYFTTDTVEGALQELGAANGNPPAFDSTASAGAAEHLKNVQAFVARMNGVSSGIGMTNTTWMTPSGLYTPSASISYSTAYNSHTTANDLMRLLILCRHTPEAYESMSKVTYEFTLSGERKQTDNILLNGARYKTWAATHGYTMLAAKGGSLGGTDGEIGENGILNVAMILEDSTENVYAWVIVGLQNTEADKELLLVLAHDLIEMCKGEPATQEILDAAGREPYPIGMACCQLTESGTFAEDIAELENAIAYNGNAVRVSASTAKMMTMCVEALNTQANHLITLTPDDMVGGSGFSELSAGDVISVKDAMAVCMMRSDNALATALGRDAGQRMATGESSVFIAHRNETSYADIMAAISAGKDVIVEAAISGSLYQMRFARKMAPASATPNVLYFFGMAAKDLYYTSVAPDDTWSSVSAVSLQEKLTAGDNLTISNNTISVTDVIPIIGSITASTNLNTLATGMYRVYGITHTDLPEQAQLYGNLLQTDGNYKVQIFFGGKTGDANIYVRRWQTGSASFTAWKSMQSAAITDAGGYFQTDTVEAALQSIGAELAGINTLVGSGVIA